MENISHSKSSERYHHQHYAYDELGNCVHIDDVEKDKKYLCIHCNKEVIPKRGKINEHHFAHKEENPDCKWETYLHSLAKFKIAEWLKKTPSIEIILPTYCPKSDNCPLKDSSYDCKGECKSFNLKNFFEIKGMEEKYMDFTPDILLMSKEEYKQKGTPIFIEIFVSHPCSKEKILSGNRIIEFKIDGEYRIDELINGDKIDYRDSHAVMMYNFIKQYSAPIVDKEVGRFTLHKSGKSHIDTIKCSQIEEDKKGLCQIIVNAQMLCAPGFYSWGFAIAQKKGIKFKSCNICKYSVYNEYYNKRICKLYKIHNLEPACSKNDAVRCPYFSQSIINLNEECPVNVLDTDSNNYIFIDNTQQT